MVVPATGARSLPYRDEFIGRAAGVAARGLFGRFIQNRQLRSTPEVTDASNPDRPVQIRFPILEDDFLLPIQRQQSLQLDLVPLVPPSTAQPGRFREEVTFAIPAGFTVRADFHLNEERVFARYQSESKIEELKPATTSGSTPAEMESFWKNRP